MVGGNTFAKTICSICYEDLKPIVEDLQSISICGHVFHELCIQQWFEYCSNGKKKNCPVCKQTCSESSVSRLYFQSVGDPNDPSLSQRSRDGEVNPEELRREVKRLEGKVSGLSSALERQEKDLNEVKEELCICKDRVKKETSLKTDALKQKSAIQQLLQLKSGELDRSTLECTRLQDRNMALAKELAAVKLVADLNLEEEEVLKLASLGKEGNTKETIDILRKSLVIRNKNYKELMVKCNALGRGEARSLSKLEKAKEKMKKLKTRVRELETVVEVKDNEVLRALKSSKKTTCDVEVLNGVDRNPNSSRINKCSFKDQMKEPDVPVISPDQTGSVYNNSFCSRETEKFKPSKDKCINNSKDEISAFNQETGSDFLLDEDASEISTPIHEFSHIDSENKANEDAVVKKRCLSRPGAASDKKSNAQEHGSSNKGGVSVPMSVSKDEDVILLIDDSTQDEPLLNIRKETSSPFPVFQSGESCFSGGLLGPDGSKWHLGKWCKRGQNKGSTESSKGVQGSSASTGDLIAVGADGRGGRIKVLRSLNQSSRDGKENSTLAKRCKYGAKTSSLQSQGCLQIEHFFGRSGQ